MPAHALPRPPPTDDNHPDFPHARENGSAETERDEGACRYRGKSASLEQHVGRPRRLLTDETRHKRGRVLTADRRRGPVVARCGIVIRNEVASARLGITALITPLSKTADAVRLYQRTSLLSVPMAQ